MSKEQYYDMCDMLSTEPVDKDIPVEQEDLLEEVQLAFMIYSQLAPKFDSFSGSYHGKDYNNLPILFDMYNINKVEMKEYFKIILILNSIDTEHINSKLANKHSQK